MVISAEPQRVALKILFAAWVALAAMPGVVAPSENHLNSFSACPVNCAWMLEPVRMSPGQTVVTRMPLWRSSAWRPSEKPLRANLLAT